MVFDAYVCAEKGDFTDIALMCLMYDQDMGQLGRIISCGASCKKR